jgi:hypothetical protein
MDQFNLRGEQLIDAVAHDGMSLPAADFHQCPGPRHGAADFFDHAFDQWSAAVFIDVFHELAGSDLFLKAADLFQQLERFLGF